MTTVLFFKLFDEEGPKSRTVLKDISNNVIEYNMKLVAPKKSKRREQIYRICSISPQVKKNSMYLKCICLVAKPLVEELWTFVRLLQG